MDVIARYFTRYDFDLMFQSNLPQNVTSPYRYGTQSTHASGISEAKSGAP